MELTKPNADPVAALQKQIEGIEKKVQTGKLSCVLSADGEYASRSAMEVLEAMIRTLREQSPADGAEAFKLLKGEFDKRTRKLKRQADHVGEELSNIFAFCEEVYGGGQEVLILTTELTISQYCACFISRYGCEEYYKHNKDLLLHERKTELAREIKAVLTLED